VTVKRYEITQPGLSGLKIVYLSDFHYSKATNKHKIKKIVDKTNALSPDVVILGGDFTNDNVNYVETIFEELSKIKAKLGVYVVTGNHDYSPGNHKEIDKMLRKYDMIDLNNTSYWINYQQHRFKLGGIADFTFEKPKPELTVNDTTPLDYVIFVSHQPDYIMELDDTMSQSIDLMLSGHTHGGQITFWGLYAPYIPSKYGQNFRTGKTKVKSTDLIVSSGLGETNIPLRFFSPSQIVVIAYK
jgi:predicted MPP superfamily phosphohydrolase